MVRIKDMKMREEKIKDNNGELKEFRLILEDITVEDAREFLKKLGDALDERP